MPNDYLDWLRDLVKEPGLFSDLFFETAMSVDFIPIIQNDENRVRDGLELRYIWSQMALNPPRMPDTRFCTIFELLVGLAKRINVALNEPEHPDLTGYYFEELLDNIGVFDVDEQRLSEQEAVWKYKAIFEKLIYRTYDRNGQKGGLFPVKYSPVDQRIVEIWYQMQLYLSDRI